MAKVSLSLAGCREHSTTSRRRLGQRSQRGEHRSTADPVFYTRTCGRPSGNITLSLSEFYQWQLSEMPSYSQLLFKTSVFADQMNFFDGCLILAFVLIWTLVILKIVLLHTVLLNFPVETAVE